MKDAHRTAIEGSEIERTISIPLSANAHLSGFEKFEEKKKR
jgi:hypothetical protein